MQKCTRCEGKGFIPKYHYNQGGICFGCHGEGLIFDSPEKANNYREQQEEIRFIQKLAEEEYEEEYAEYGEEEYMAENGLEY